MQTRNKRTGKFSRNLSEKICLFCNKQFKPRLKKTKFCSKVCCWNKSKGRKQTPESVAKRAKAKTTISDII